jgi:ribosomal-protein-alanine N-acetyltransferase
VTHNATGGLVGVINVSNIIRGAFHSAFLGYYAFSDYAGQGLMQEGMRLVLYHAFRRLTLHRLEANIQPENTASLKLIRQCGFVREGYSKRYLKILGRWRDHERWAILAEDFKPNNLTRRQSPRAIEGKSK